MKVEPAALLPCPFCGSTHIDRLGTFNGLEVAYACIDCGANCGDSPSHTAVDAWNKRAIPAGHVLVPVEPTEAMITAMVKSVYGPATFKVTPATVEMENMRDAFGAAIAAANGE